MELDELFSLRMDEHEAVVRAAVEEVADEKPVVSGVGRGTAIAFKDGSGSTDSLVRIRLATEGRLLLMNGTPTAEVACHAY